MQARYKWSSLILGLWLVLGGWPTATAAQAPQATGFYFQAPLGPQSHLPGVTLTYALGLDLVDAPAGNYTAYISYVWTSPLHGTVSGPETLTVAHPGGSVTHPFAIQMTTPANFQHGDALWLRIQGYLVKPDGMIGSIASGYLHLVPPSFYLRPAEQTLVVNPLPGQVSTTTVILHYAPTDTEIAEAYRWDPVISGVPSDWGRALTPVPALFLYPDTGESGVLTATLVYTVGVVWNETTFTHPLTATLGGELWALLPTRFLGVLAPVTVTLVPNQRPVAQIAALTAPVYEADLVQLNAAGSYDPDGHTPLTYQWTQTGGPTVSLTVTDQSTLTFRAPPTGEVTLTFSVQVTDTYGFASGPATLSVPVRYRTRYLYLPLVLRSWPPRELIPGDVPDAPPGYPAAVGTYYVENFDHPNDNDWYTFSATAGVTYTLTVSELGIHNDTLLALFAPDMTTLLAENDDAVPGDPRAGSQLVWRAPTTATYQVRVRHYDWRIWGAGTEYTLLIAANTGGWRAR